MNGERISLHTKVEVKVTAMGAINFMEVKARMGDRTDAFPDIREGDSLIVPLYVLIEMLGPHMSKIAEWPIAEEIVLHEDWRAQH